MKKLILFTIVVITGLTAQAQKNIKLWYDNRKDA